MPYISVVDKAFRAGIAAGCRTIGDIWSVYRINDASTGQVIQDSNLVKSGKFARIMFATPKTMIDSVPLDMLMYSGFCDTRDLVIGDVLVWNGPTNIDNNADGRIYTLTDVRPLVAPLFVRTEIISYISRPHPILQGHEPLLGDGGYIGTNKFQEAICSLTDGLYSFSNESNVVAAAIPIGLHQHRRVGDRQHLKYPTATPRATYYGFIPLLAGVSIQPGDIISDATGGRFEIMNTATFETGLQGTEVICESLFA